MNRPSIRLLNTLRIGEYQKNIAIKLVTWFVKMFARPLKTVTKLLEFKLSKRILIWIKFQIKGGFRVKSLRKQRKSTKNTFHYNCQLKVQGKYLRSKYKIYKRKRLMRHHWQAVKFVSLLGKKAANQISFIKMWFNSSNTEKDR